MAHEINELSAEERLLCSFVWRNAQDRTNKASTSTPILDHAIVFKQIEFRAKEIYNLAKRLSLSNAIWLLTKYQPVHGGGGGGAAVWGDSQITGTEILVGKFELMR